MRGVVALLPLLLAIAGFILSLLVLLSGRNEGFLQDVYVLKLDTTRIGENATVSNLGDRIGVDDTPTNIPAIDDRLRAAADRIDEKIEDLIDTAAGSIGLKDVYIAHIMNYCTGVWTGNDQDNDTKITDCSKPEIPFKFNPIDIFESEIAGMSLEDTGLPVDSIQDVIGALQVAYQTMSVTYVIGVAFAGLSVVFGFLSITGSRITSLCNSIAAALAFLFLGIASAIGTVIAIRGRDVFNDRAGDSGVVASDSGKYLGMTWSAVGCMILASILGCVACIAGRKKNRRHSRTTEEPLVSEKPRRRFGFFGRRRQVV